MTTEYVVKKCQSFGFARSIDIFNEHYSRKEPVYVLSSRATQLTNDSFITLHSIDEMAAIDREHSVVVIDLECDLFNDIRISMPKINKAGESSKEQQISKEEMQEQLSGKSTSLDAFSNNMFAVIYGKKGANIQSCNTKQNHGVLDSLARNGVVCTPKTQEVLSVQRVIDYLKKLKRFSVFGIHSGLELPFDEHEYPSEISHPSYKLANGEITAILYRYILINFYGYCSIVTDSMRENAYIF